MQVFQGSALQTNELFTLNESIRWLLKTEVGSFITDYFQNQLLTRGLSEVLDQVQLHSGDEQLVVLGNGVHDAPSLEFCQLERLVEVVVTPFIRDALLTG
ncbi:Proline-rich protein 5-like [Dissostichus eleginoides]|uniref:Proline-rich protein 5-like n=1 Tax=Dissostichus eleginoides TaxID=100907 RepID=A0AAD9BQW6_DISEL|nr:Proline-rich protein 5-like [Dissostichus eleginoides]